MKTCWFCTENSENWLIFDLKLTELSNNIYFIYIERSAQTQSMDLLAPLQIEIRRLNLPADHNTDSRVEGILFIGYD